MTLQIEKKTSNYSETPGKLWYQNTSWYRKFGARYLFLSLKYLTAQMSERKNRKDFWEEKNPGSRTIILGRREYQATLPSPHLLVGNPSDGSHQYGRTFMFASGQRTSWNSCMLHKLIGGSHLLLMGRAFSSWNQCFFSKCMMKHLQTSEWESDIPSVSRGCQK